tara:strand:+ start:128 stop:1183 length:1056 start_codon:yes stop_codon:yes gene_type:complete
MIQYIGHPKNLSELKESIKLATKTFRKNNNNINYRNKLIIWKYKKNIDYKNIIIIKNNKNEIIGLLRIVPKKLKLNSKVLKVCGLSSICIHENYRSKGLSIKLINFSLQYAQKNSFDLAILFARKNLDHYYTKFGFYGISHYSLLTLKSFELLKQCKEKYELKNAKISDLRSIQKIYNSTYLKHNGIFYRDHIFWKYIMNKNKIDNNNFEIIKDKKNILGYLIRNSNHIYELGLSNKINKDKLLRTLHLNTNDIKIDITQNHPFLNFIYNLDHTFSFRQCAYGGHMLKILNINKIKKISNYKLNKSDFNKIKKNKIDNELTLNLLGLINFSQFPKKIKYLSYFSFLNSDQL